MEEDMCFRVSGSATIERSDFRLSDNGGIYEAAERN